MAHCQIFIDAVEQSTETEIPAALALLEQRLAALMNCEAEHMQQMMAEGKATKADQSRMARRHSKIKKQFALCLKEFKAMTAMTAAITKENR